MKIAAVVLSSLVMASAVPAGAVITLAPTIKPQAAMQSPARNMPPQAGRREAVPAILLSALCLAVLLIGRGAPRQPRSVTV
jgi:hypothetical protein